MNQFILNRQQVREVDRRAIEDLGMPGLLLMENAGRGCVDTLRSLGAKGPFLIACGKGNNAGDGFVIARHLDNAGLDVRVLLLAPPESLTGDAAENFRFLKPTGVRIVEAGDDGNDTQLTAAMANCEWIIDAMLGTGATGTPRPPYDRIIRQLNEAAAHRMAIDLPSGLDCDTGQAGDPTFQADHTCTFVAAKPGLMAEEAQSFVGQLHVIDIGVPRSLILQVAEQETS